MSGPKNELDWIHGRVSKSVSQSMASLMHGWVCEWVYEWMYEWVNQPIHKMNDLGKMAQWPLEQLPHSLTSQSWFHTSHVLSPVSPVKTQHLPDNDAHHPHNSLIEAVEEIPKDSALMFHATNDQPKGHREDHKAQGIDAIGWARHRYSLLEAQHLLQGAQGPGDIFQEASSIVHWGWGRHGGGQLRSILCPHYGPCYQPRAILCLELKYMKYGKIGAKINSSESPEEVYLEHQFLVATPGESYLEDLTNA